MGRIRVSGIPPGSKNPRIRNSRTVVRGLPYVRGEFQPSELRSDSGQSPESPDSCFVGWAGVLWSQGLAARALRPARREWGSPVMIVVSVQGLLLQFAGRKPTLASLTAYRPYRMESETLADRLALSHNYSPPIRQALGSGSTKPHAAAHTDHTTIRDLLPREANNNQDQGVQEFTKPAHRKHMT